MNSMITDTPEGSSKKLKIKMSPTKRAKQSTTHSGTTSADISAESPEQPREGPGVSPDISNYWLNYNEINDKCNQN